MSAQGSLLLPSSPQSINTSSQKDPFNTYIRSDHFSAPFSTLASPLSGPSRLWFTLEKPKSSAWPARTYLHLLATSSLPSLLLIHLASVAGSCSYCSLNPSGKLENSGLLHFQFFCLLSSFPRYLLYPSPHLQDFTPGFSDPLLTILTFPMLSVLFHLLIFFHILGTF